MIRIAVCDDETFTCSEIETMVLDFAKSRGLQVETEVYYSGEAFVFKAGKALYRRYLEEIRYFACSGKKIEIHDSCETQEFYGNMREVWRQIEGKGFLTVHKSYIVNTTFVSAWHYDRVELSDGTVLPISQRYRKAVRESLMARYGGVL